MFFCQLHDRHKRGHVFSRDLGVSMPSPFRKGIACHGSMYILPFCPELFVDLDNDALPKWKNRDSTTERLIQQNTKFNKICALQDQD